MRSAKPTPVAVLLHLANTRHWSDFATALQAIPVHFDLIVNLVEGLNSPAQILQQIALIRENYPDARIIRSENRGMDIGGMFRLFQCAIDGNYTALLYAHSKSDEQWRQTMLSTLTHTSRFAIDALSNAQPGPAVGMIGSYTYPFDYYNIGPFISLMSELNITLNTRWENYFSRYPESRTLPIEQRIAQAVDKANKGSLKSALRPELDLEYAQHVLGDPHVSEQRVNSVLLRRMIDDHVIGPLPYFPGNFFWISKAVIGELARYIDFKKEYLSLPINLESDKKYQSRAHAWERALPVFAVKNGFRLQSLKSSKPR